VTFSTRSWLAAALGLWMAHPLWGGEPGRLEVVPGQALKSASVVSPNQQIAGAIADHLRQSGHLRRYNIDITFHDGLAELAGTVTDQVQREEVLRLVQGVPGVERVQDRIVLATGPEMLTQTQALLAPGPELGPQPKKEGISRERNNDSSNNNRNNSDNANSNDNARDKGKGVEPVPIYQAPPMAADLNPPRMPPYAWPTYAPYNNLSRVAYPTLYPYNAWPFIGPCYPFPKVPLGWRSVKLQWQDGYWWYSKTATGHDWWRLRYW
jgi:hypothetical protein